MEDEDKKKELDTAIDPAQEPSKDSPKLSSYEETVGKYINKRVREMKDYRKGLKIEEKWRSADKEYAPGKINLGSAGKRFEADQETGLRSKLVPVGDSAAKWRSDIADPTLLTKIQTALSIIIDRNPEAMLTALEKKYEATTDLAYSLWKRNWEITNSKEVLKLFCFNLAKYGWAVGRSYPRIVTYNKSVLTELDAEHPENNKYEEKEYTAFNDVARQNLNPFRTWIDEMTVPFDRFSMNDCYYEIDYSYDAAKLEFGHYKNFDFVNRSAKVADTEEGENQEKTEEENLSRTDIVTVGFYENRIKDLYCIYIPSQKLPLYCSPLPNDEGNLSIWQSMWILRSATSPYGISLWEMIQGDKELYDKMSNMTMDQVVLSIMKMIFYTGSNTLLGDGKINIVPGKFEQIVNGDVKFLEIPGPGKDAWDGLQRLKQRMDDNSGITPTLEGEVTGKTLGEILHAKESSLKRLKVPLENISEAIEQDAYLTLSWMSQIYSTPEVKEFSSLDKLVEYEKENSVTHDELFAQTNEDGGTDGYQATFLPSMALHLEDSEGKLYESKDSKFFQIGKDIKQNQLQWRGIFRVIPKSLLAPSAELEKQRKMELFNVIAPLLPMDPNVYKKAVNQIIKVNEEDPEDWLPETWTMDAQPANPLFTPNPMMQPQVDPATGQPMAPADGGQSMQASAGVAPAQGAPTVVPEGSISTPSTSQLMGGGMPNLRS